MLKISFSLIFFLISVVYCNDDILVTSGNNLDSDVSAKFFISYPEKENWFRAYKFCMKRGQQLVTIESSAKQTEIGTFISSLNLGNVFNEWKYGIWTSGTDNGFHGSYFWMTNGFDFYQYTNWKAGEPNGHNEHCVAIYNVDSHGFQWNDLGCDMKIYFICENHPSSELDVRMNN